MSNHQYISYASTIDGFNVNTTKRSGIRLQQMRSIIGQHQAMTSHYSRLFTYRFDVRLPSYTADNTALSDFIRKLSKWIKRQYKTKRVGYTWCREQEKAKSQHYHLVVMLDGNVIRHPARLSEKIDELLKVAGMAVGWASNPYDHFHRTDTESYQKAIYKASYLAKERGKGYKPDQVKNAGHSRIRAA